MAENDPGSPDTRILDARIGQMLAERFATLERRGGGGHDSGMDAWQASVENRLTAISSRLDGLGTKIDSQFKWVLGVYGAGFTFLLGALTLGYFRLSDQIDAGDAKLDSIITSLAALTGQVPQ